MSEKKVYQILSLCQKGYNLVSGEFAVKQAVLNKEVFLVIVANEASSNTQKLFNDKCRYRNIPCIKWGSSEDIGRSLGKEHRVVVGITNEKLANKIMQMI
ncbi:MAG: hypothetical protein BEN18_03135 [Epulopiscium sp. Nuni2H_MBin001]|nr:MAG: hypothetical protein BEN18_03135 [Epulopiscium sp. Nuni2H_MBin001]